LHEGKREKLLLIVEPEATSGNKEDHLTGSITGEPVHLAEGAVEDENELVLPRLLVIFEIHKKERGRFLRRGRGWEGGSGEFRLGGEKGQGWGREVDKGRGSKEVHLDPAKSPEGEPEGHSPEENHHPKGDPQPEEGALPLRGSLPPVGAILRNGKCFDLRRNNPLRSRSRRFPLQRLDTLMGILAQPQVADEHYPLPLRILFRGDPGYLPEERDRFRILGDPDEERNLIPDENGTPALKLETILCEFPLQIAEELLDTRVGKGEGRALSHAL
jgi:hypothetical protein